MSELMVKRLSRLPVGTVVELSYGDGGSHYETVCGTITDSDYSASLELKVENGRELLLDFSIIRGLHIVKTISETLSELSAGTEICFSYGGDAPSEPCCKGCVVENDCTDSIAIKTGKKQEIVLNYSVFTGLLVCSEKPKAASMPGSAAAKRTVGEPVQEEQVIEKITVTDLMLKSLFDSIPAADRKRLAAPYDSFKYGAKTSDRAKTLQAAKNARNILESSDRAGYSWAKDSAKFCGYLLMRAGVLDQNAFLIGECFWEAAYCCFFNKQYIDAEVYAALSLIEEGTERQRELETIITESAVESDDASVIRALAEDMPGSFEICLRQLIGAMLGKKGARLKAGQELDSSIQVLESLYQGQEAYSTLRQSWRDGRHGDSAIAGGRTAAPADTVQLSGVISRLQWADNTGTIQFDGDKKCTFRYADIADKSLRQDVESCLSADMNGRIYWVSFDLDGEAARNIRSTEPPLTRARNEAVKRNFREAMSLCKGAFDTADRARAMGDFVQYSAECYRAEKDESVLDEAKRLYEENKDDFPGDAKARAFLAQIFSFLHDFPAALQYTADALSDSELPAKLRATFLAQYIRICFEANSEKPDPELMEDARLKSDEWLKLYESAGLSVDANCLKYYPRVLRWRLRAECAQNMLEEAERDFQELRSVLPYDNKLHELRVMLDDAHRRSAAGGSTDAQDDAGETQPGETAAGSPEGEKYEDSGEEENADDTSEATGDIWDVEEYVDEDGWDALHTTKEQVVRYAFEIRGEGSIPAMLAYLKAGSDLNPEIAPVYRMAALAANDPMSAQDYSVASLSGALNDTDGEYSDFTDCCLAAAFLRSSFISGRGFDYSAQGLRSSIGLTWKMPALRDAYDTLEEFRSQSDSPIDIYAKYRSRDVRALEESLDALQQHAQELYTKFVLTPPREGVKFERLARTREIIFARDGDLASMLNSIINRDQDALDAVRDEFVADCLNGVPSFTKANISARRVDAIVADGWERAGKLMPIKKVTAVLQGERRNNLRSNVTEVLSTIAQWYQLSEQNAGLAWRTEAGESAYSRLGQQLADNLEEVSGECDELMEYGEDAQMYAGLSLLKQTARELAQRLGGEWTFGQEKYFYADFLNSDQIMLDENFLPEMNSTFCALPEFNVLARIRRHIEGPKLGFQEHLNEIYGTDRTRNNYGTAERIMQYLRDTGEENSVSIPANAEQYELQTRQQVDIRLRSFRESYALAMNYGQIMQSDAFCYSLENTVRYWYAACVTSKNYGFFTTIVQEAYNQIHISARQYECQLNQQLDALIAGNRQQFDAHPEYVEAIRDQIGQQNFIVAEDWMRQVRMGDFQIELQQPEALGYLTQFWSSYVQIYDRVADSSRTLSALLGHRDARNKDSKRAQQLIGCWLSNGNPSNATRITQLLNLLGWQNLTTRSYDYPQEPRTEIYHIAVKDASAGFLNPIHPIAAFGSRLAQDGAFVVCLYGAYDCDRLYEKIRTLDSLDGNKIILLDYALGSTDRRMLAWKLKRRESGLRNVYLVIDRVLICYLADFYNENLINRILMAVAVPFSYCQPYVPDSTQTMPPEIFIGRKDELIRIEQPDGVNLIYGGRQLGKSALFKKARADIDYNQQRRAILVEIKDRDCASAAMEVSRKLIDLKLTPDAEVTDDWEILCRNILRRLSSDEDPIRYFLLMLDEADAFIEDCALCNYRPLVALKDVQQTIPGRFKFVLAGLHNIIRFNREVALGHNAVITHFPSLKVTPFRPAEAQELLIEPMSYLGFSIASKVTASQILATANYFPGLIQLYCQKLIESVRSADYAGYDIRKTPPYVVTDNHLRRVMADKEFAHQIHEKFEITLLLDDCYYPLALIIGWMHYVQPAQGGYTARDVLHQAKDLSIKAIATLSVDKINALLEELEDLNILRGVGQDTYMLASKNFRDLLGSQDEIFDKLAEQERGE